MPKLARLWPDSTVVCIGGGPSLTTADVDYVRGKAKVIAINNAYQLAPWADVLYACDGRWWRLHYPQVQHLPALKLSLQVAGDRKPAEVLCLRKTRRGGLETDPSGLAHGHNSGYQSINAAYHLGARRILLLGYDMRLGTGGQSHWHGEHPWRMHPSFNTWIALYHTLAKPLTERGIEVLNCSRVTHLDAFPKADLRTVLQAREVAA